MHDNFIVRHGHGPSTLQEVSTGFNVHVIIKYCMLSCTVMRGLSSNTLFMHFVGAIDLN